MGNKENQEDKDNDENQDKKADGGMVSGDKPIAHEQLVQPVRESAGSKVKKTS